jgi:hypothetical protein
LTIGPAQRRAERAAAAADLADPEQAMLAAYL